MRYLVLLENKKKVGDARVIFKFRNIDFEQIWSDRFIVHCSEEEKVDLHNIFDWMSLIAIE